MLLDNVGDLLFYLLHEDGHVLFALQIELLIVVVLCLFGVWCGVRWSVHDIGSLNYY